MTNTTIAATDTARIQYATPRDVFAAFEGGASISVEEFPNGSAAAAAERAQNRSREDGDASLVVSINNDSVGGAHNDTVWFEPDEDARLEVIRRARIALDNAEAALLAVGWMDKVHLCPEDYMALPERERNAFTLGQDSMRGQTA